MVVSAPASTSAHPAARRCSWSSLSANKKPMPTPNKTRVPAMRPISGMVTICCFIMESSQRSLGNAATFAWRASLRETSCATLIPENAARMPVFGTAVALYSFRLRHESDREVHYVRHTLAHVPFARHYGERGSELVDYSRIVNVYLCVRFPHVRPRLFPTCSRGAIIRLHVLDHGPDHGHRVFCLHSSSRARPCGRGSLPSYAGPWH